MKKTIKIILIILLIILILAGIFLAILTIQEYRPKEQEATAIATSTTDTLKEGESYQILSWNLGYLGLSAQADFFMDGGKSVRSIDKDGVLNNLSHVSDYLASSDADFIALQEVDIDSKRSYYMDEYTSLSQSLASYNHTFAYNYKAAYVPYPLETIGKVNAGIATYSKYTLQDAQRIALPCPFKWPIRTCNLKRCLLITRIPVADTDQELVLINLHLEAYDDGEGKRAQTKKLLELMKAEYAKGNYCIACGDFNQTFSNIDLSNYASNSESSWKPSLIDTTDFGQDFSLLMDATTPSCRSLEKAYTGEEDFPVYVIDGFIVSNNLQINQYKCQDLDFQWSDHNPVTLDVTIPKTE